MEAESMMDRSAATEAIDEENAAVIGVMGNIVIDTVVTLEGLTEEETVIEALGLELAKVTTENTKGEVGERNETRTLEVANGVEVGTLIGARIADMTMIEERTR